MRKLTIIGTALAIGTAVIMAQAQAAPAAQSPYCNVPFKKWSTNWGQYYGCYGKSAYGAQFGYGEPQQARPHHVVSHSAPAGHSPYCDVPFKKWSTNWGQYYHCYGI